jgi:hypothetical protein
MATAKVTAIGEYKMKDSSGLEDGYELVFTGLRTEIMFSIMRIPAERVTWRECSLKILSLRIWLTG